MKQQEFETIASELRDVMFNIGQQFFHSEVEADDVAQEGLLTLWKLHERLEAGLSHRGLAIRIAKHCCMDMVRKRKRTVELNTLDGTGQQTQPETALSPHEQLEETELNDALNNAIGQLKPSERNLFELRQMQGLSNDEISQRTQIPKASVKSMVSTARKKVFEELKRRLRQ